MTFKINKKKFNKTIIHKQNSQLNNKLSQDEKELYKIFF